MDLASKLFKGDRVIWVIFMFLCLVSVIEVFSATSTIAYKNANHWAPIVRLSLIHIFVEGIRVADTLWILPAQYRSVANDKVNFATLQAYNDSVVAKGLPAIKNLLTEEMCIRDSV